MNESYPRFRFVSGMLLFILAPQLAVIVLPLAADAWTTSTSEFPTSIPDSASPSGYSVVTYRGSQEISRRPATAEDIARTREGERVAGKAWAILVSIGVIAGAVALAWFAARLMTAGRHPARWRLIGGLLLVGYGFLTLAGFVVAQVHLANTREVELTGLRTLLYGMVPLGALWISGGTYLLLSRRRRSTNDIRAT